MKAISEEFSCWEIYEVMCFCKKEKL